ncbi:MAG: hypothetical protein Q9170_001855 [Blastenia crenularia]
MIEDQSRSLADKQVTTSGDKATVDSHESDERENSIFQPIKSRSRSPNRDRTRAAGKSLSLQHSRSYGDGHGFTCFSDNERHAEDGEPQGEDAEEKAFEVQWEGEDDPAHPRSMSKLRKWTVVLIVSSSSACVTCTSSMYVSTYGQITKEFHCSQIVATLGLSLFVMGLGIGPMLLGPLSEFYGRKPIYVVSFTFFLIWLIPCAVAQNIQTMLVARFLDGLAGSAFLSVAGGTIGDMFNRSELQAPMMIYSASPFIGPPIGPIVASFINYFTSW